MEYEGLSNQRLIRRFGYWPWHVTKMVYSSLKMGFGQRSQLTFEMCSKLKISPYLFNHLFDSKKPKILAPTPQSVKMVHLRLCCLANQMPLARFILLHYIQLSLCLILLHLYYFISYILLICRIYHQMSVYYYCTSTF